jgi:hypothetical protein
MSRDDIRSYDEISHDESSKLRRETYRVRRASASRRRSRKKVTAPGGMRQRRNKHWSW